jgi:pilus assembly protein CpaC
MKTRNQDGPHRGFERRASHAAIAVLAIAGSGALLTAAGQAIAQDARTGQGPLPATPAVIKGTTVAPAPTIPSAQPAVAETGSVGSEVGAAMDLVVGKSTLLRLPAPIERISIGNPAIADVTLLTTRELYLLGKTFGSTNVILWRRGGPATVIDVTVNIDVEAVRSRLAVALPNEKGIVAHAAADSIVLAGTVSSAAAADQAVEIAEAYLRAYGRGLTAPITAGQTEAAAGQRVAIAPSVVRGATGGARAGVVNMMKVAQPQQVVLEVVVAEISRNLLDKLGVGMTAGWSSSGGNWRYSVVTNFLTQAAGGVIGLGPSGNRIAIDAEKQDGLVKVLAEPNIMSISGQEASFLAGGRIFIPVANSATSTGGVPVITLEEKEFGIGVKFTPTVLEGGRINLRVAPEVSQVLDQGTPFTTVNGVTSVLPTFTARRAQTTVQLMDGQSLAIAGLIRNDVGAVVKRLPVLGEIPILGALFRSSEFKNERTELVFVVTPRLAKPVPDAGYSLPTDNFVPPSRTEFFLNGQLEGSGRNDVPPDSRQLNPPGGQGGANPSAPGGYQLK